VRRRRLGEAHRERKVFRVGLRPDQISRHAEAGPLRPASLLPGERPGRTSGETLTLSRDRGRHGSPSSGTARSLARLSHAAAGGGERRDAFSNRAILERVTDPLATDETRIDRWLTAVRLVKTRPLATRLCEGGHVLVKGLPAKPSTKVRAGDRVEARIADRERVVEVVRPIESRVGALVAATCYVDHSPPVVPEARPEIMLMRGEGRPGKRLRRELERLRRGTDA
jgi:ribosome-associated heat shock protein Hsp15